MLQKVFFVLALLVWPLVGEAATSSQCGGTHVVREGETIFAIANSYYGDGRKWTLIYYANREQLGSNPSQIPGGTRLRIPCLQSSNEDERKLEREDAELKLLTGGEYKPFTDQSLPGGGLITELVNASFENSPSPVPFSLNWEDDWAKHLFPLLDSKKFDVGFPWLQPNCEENRANERCRNFHFSDPLFEMLVLLFTRKDSGFDYSDDSDIHGKTLCRPKGYYDHDLDRQGRKWLKNDLIRLVRASSPKACFQKLVNGEVDAVTLNEFTGRLAIKSLGIEDKVVAQERPLSIEGLHVVVSKTHARGTTFLYRFNEGLSRLKESDRYEQVISRHLDHFWKLIESDDSQPEFTAVPEPEPKSKPKPRRRAEPAPKQEKEPREVSAKAACIAERDGLKRLSEDKSMENAVGYFQKAITSELPVSEYVLGIAYFNGKGVGQDRPRGIELFKKSAADGLADPAYELMKAYKDGSGVAKSAEKMLFWLIAADLLANKDHRLRDTLSKIMTSLRNGSLSGQQISGMRDDFRQWQEENRSQYPNCQKLLAGGGERTQEPAPEKPRESGIKSTGTGFFVSDSGHILTNHHVVDGCRRLDVRTLGNPIAQAQLVDISKDDDLALLKTRDFDPPHIARFRTHSDAKLGEDVFVFGFPLAGYLTTSGNLTKGIISGLEGLRNNSGHYQITAPVQPGNSGGPVVDNDGNVVGVVVSIVNQQFARKHLNTDVQNANFVIKGHLARGFLRANGVDVLTSGVTPVGESGNGVRIVRQIAAQIRCYE